MITLKYLLLGLTYLGFGWGYVPGLRMNRAGIAIVGSGFMVALGVVNLKTACGLESASYVCRIVRCD